MSVGPMKLSKILEHLRCPICMGDLDFVEKGNANKSIICTKCGEKYYMYGKIIDLLPKAFVRGSDLRWMKYYDRNAKDYYRLFHRILPILTLGAEGRIRKRWINKLGLREGNYALDVATGTGRNIPYLCRRVGSEGLVFGVDISFGMLQYAVRYAEKWENVILVRANASHLPFPDNIFDAVFHVGGINTFEDKELAIREMVRVAKTGARIIVIDEGLDPKLRNTKRGKKLIASNALYASMPPIKEFQRYARNIRVEWHIIFNKLIAIWPYYVLQAEKLSFKVHVKVKIHRLCSKLYINIVSNSFS